MGRPQKTIIRRQGCGVSREGGESRPNLINLLVLTLALSFGLIGCTSVSKKSRDELTHRGIEFSERAFFEQVRVGRLEFVQLFLSAGMSPEIQENGFTPLLEAARRGRSEIALGLIEEGAGLNAKDPFGVTALMFSLIAGSTDVALKLIEKGADVNIRDVDGRTALVEALTSENEVPPEIVEALVRRGADVNVRLAGGLTPLMIAASGDPRIVRILAGAGADVQARDDSGASALERAKENPENIRILEEAQTASAAGKKREGL